MRSWVSLFIPQEVGIKCQVSLLLVEVSAILFRSIAKSVACLMKVPFS